MKHSNLELFIGLLATAFLSIGIFLYIVNEPLRIEETQQTILAHQIDEAATLYAENCAICHGAAGEGIGATPPLDGLQSMPYDDLFKTISRGRYNTAMPAWSLDEGGSLSDYQIQELVSMIQNGNWQDIQVRATEMGVVPSLPFSAEPDAEALEAIASLPDGDVLARGVTLYAENCVACHSADGMGSDIAPPLNQAALRALPAEELTRTISSGVPGTLMAGWGNIISEEDIQALVSLIQRWDEIPSGSIPTPETPPIPVTEELLAMGESIYSANCAQCHGPSGQGTPRAPALNVKPLLTSTNDAAIQQIITLGVPGTMMPAWGDRLTEAEIQAVVGFIRQWEATAPEVATPIRPGQGGGGRGRGRGAGGPPWMQNSNEAPPAMPIAIPGTQIQQSTDNPTVTVSFGNGHGKNEGAAENHYMHEAEEESLFDWRIPALFGTVFFIALIFLLIGYRRLQQLS